MHDIYDTRETRDAHDSQDARKADMRQLHPCRAKDSAVELAANVSTRPLLGCARRPVQWVRRGSLAHTRSEEG
eukprot:15060151-Alexandrium_andersonii.AAC.1